MTQSANKPRWRTPVYWLRLILFFVVALTITIFALNIIFSEQSADEYLAPAPTTVEVPADLAFAPQNITFTGGDDLTLAGWYVPPENGATIIMLHGYGNNRTEMQFRAEALTQAGYGILAYDLRAHGASEGDTRSYGWQDVADVGGAIDFLKQQPDVDADKLGIFGFSIGGQIALRATGDYPELRAVFADGPAVVSSADMTAPISFWGWITLPGNWWLDQAMARRLGMDIPTPLHQDITRIAPRPVFLLACSGSANPLGSEAPIVRRYYEAALTAGDNVTYWEIPEATHGAGPIARPDEYRERLVAFFDATLS